MKIEEAEGSKMSDFGRYAAEGGRDGGGLALIVVRTGVGFGESVGLAEDHSASAPHSQQSNSAGAGVTLGLVLLRWFRLGEMCGGELVHIGIVVLFLLVRLERSSGGSR